MRIITGTKRGMKLFSPKTSVSRPITDRVKESLFAVLANYDLLQDKVIADLFCGVGSLGLEALSRGAAFVTFIEKDPKIVITLKRNIEKAGFVKQSKVITANAFKFTAPLQTGKYDLIFVDPPYALTQHVGESSPLSSLLAILADRISTDAVIVIRTQKNIELLPLYGRFQKVEERQWGSMLITLLRQNQ